MHRQQYQGRSPGRIVNRALLCVACAAALALPGCADPFRVHASGNALHTVPWVVKDGSEETHGWFGPNKVDTEYRFAGSSTQYPGDVLVLSLRQGGGYSRDELIAFAHQYVAAAAQANITLDASKSAEGGRTLRNGLETHWFMVQGRVMRDPGGNTRGLFKVDDTVRIVAEVGFDGLSSTAVVAVGEATVASCSQAPILGSCQPQSNTSTWDAIVADPSGSIGGARGSDGLLYNLVTHG